MRARRLLNPSRLALLLVLVFGVGLVGLHIHEYRQLSVYDEPQHVDYVYYLLRGEIPASGDHWLPGTVKAVACRTIDFPNHYPPCGGRATSDELPNGGLTTAFGDTPLYYLGPAAAVLAAQHLVPFHVDLVDAMRSTGILWLLIAIVLMWLVWRDLRVPWLVRAATVLSLVATPVVLLSQGAVTTDATQLAAGAAIMLVALRWEQRRMPTWAAVLVAAVVVALKTTSLAVLIMACVFVLVRRLQTSEVDKSRWWRALDRRTLTLVGLFVVVFAAISVGWSVFQNSRATLDQALIPQNAVSTVHSFQVYWLFSSLLSMTTPLQPQYLQSVLLGTVGVTAEYLANAGLLVLAVVGAVRSRPGGVVRALSIATGVALLALGPLLNIMIYFGASAHFGLPARYGLSLVPVMATVGATAVRSRWGKVAYLVVAMVLYAAVVVHLLR